MPNYAGGSALNREEDTRGVPIGAVISTALPVGTAAPAGYLLCDGTSYATATYPNLFGIMQYGYGGSGANFNVPDYRNLFQRGQDTMDGRSNAAGVDIGPRAVNPFHAGGSSAGNGSYEAFMFQGHWHEIWTHTGNIDNQGGQIFNNPVTATQARLKELISDGVTTPQVSSETRPINVTVYYFVRAY